MSYPSQGMKNRVTGSKISNPPQNGEHRRRPIPTPIEIAEPVAVAKSVKPVQ